MDPVLMRRLAKPLLFLAAFIWGTSFFIMKNTLDSVPVLWLLTFRFTTGAVLVGLLCGRKWRTRFTPDYVWRGAVLGSLLFAAYAVQTFGLVGTTPSKNAFLTATYCVLVPFLHWAVSRQRPDRFHLLAAFLCITGVGLVSLNGSLTITWGDLLSLGSALFYALHICWRSSAACFSSPSPPRLSLSPAYSGPWLTCVWCPPPSLCSARTWGKCGPIPPPPR